MLKVKASLASDEVSAGVVAKADQQYHGVSWQARYHLDLGNRLWGRGVGEYWPETEKMHENVGPEQKF